MLPVPPLFLCSAFQGPHARDFWFGMPCIQASGRAEDATGFRACKPAAMLCQQPHSLIACQSEWQIQAACLEMGDQASNYKPDITFLVVQKRHHTRFFPATPQAGDRSGNVQPGPNPDSAQPQTLNP